MVHLQVENLTRQIRTSTEQQMSALQSQEELVAGFSSDISQAMETYSQETAAEMKAQAEKETGLAEQVMGLMRQLIDVQQKHKEQTEEKVGCASLILP